MYFNEGLEYTVKCYNLGDRGLLSLSQISYKIFIFIFAYILSLKKYAEHDLYIFFSPKHVITLDPHVKKKIIIMQHANNKQH